jgi:hypothetical protein
VRSALRPIRLLVVFALLAAVLPVLAGGSARAAVHSTVVLEDKKPVTNRYEPLRGPASGLVPIPSECAVSPSCDTIPIHFALPPDLTSDDEYFAMFEVGWETERVEGTNVNELDVYLFDRQGDTADFQNRPVSVAKAESLANNPERFYLAEIKQPDYWLVVVNVWGPNTGYTVSAGLVVSRITKPVESQEPEFVPPTESFEPPTPSASTQAGQPASPSGPLSSLPSLSGRGPSASVDVDLGAPGGLLFPIDPDLAGVSGNGLEDQLAADAGPVEDIRVRTPPKEVSGLEALVWLSALPVLVSAVGVALLARRRPQLFHRTA